MSHRLSADAGLRGLREQLRAQTLRLTGNRIHPMATRVGGLGVDADAAWLRAEHQVAVQTAAAAEAVQTMIDSVEFTALTSGVGSAGSKHDSAIRSKRPGCPGKRCRS